MTDIFTRLGLPEGASAADVIDWIYDPNNRDCRTASKALLLAVFQREREAGKREAWSMMCPKCTYRCHREPPCCDFLCEHTTESGLPPCVLDEEDYICPAGDAIAATFENCPLMKGEG